MIKLRKIVIFHHFGGIGGAGVSLLQTVNLLKEDYEVEVYCPSNTDMYDLLRKNNVKVEPYNFTLGSIHYYSGGPNIASRTFLKSILNIFKHKKECIDLIKKTDGEIVIINSLTTSWLAKVIKKHTNKKVICFVRETFPKNGNNIIYNCYRRILLRFCDKIFFISEYDRNVFLRSLEIEKGEVIRNSVSNNLFSNINSKTEACRNLNVNDNSFNVLFVGGMSQLKGTEIIVKAMKGLPEDVHLVIAGYNKDHYDEYSKRIYDYIEDNRLNERVKFIGVQENMVNAYSSCDVLVFPSIKPHQARPVFEAGAFKKPVIISDFPEVLEAVDDNSNGLVFIPGDVGDLREKLIYLYNNRDLCKSMGLENYLHTIKLHSENSVKDNLLKCINSVIEQDNNKF